MNVGRARRVVSVGGGAFFAVDVTLGAEILDSTARTTALSSE